MKRCDAVEQAKGYIKGIKTAKEIIDRIDREHPEYPMPMELWCDLKAEIGKAEDFIGEER